MIKLIWWYSICLSHLLQSYKVKSSSLRIFISVGNPKNDSKNGANSPISDQYSRSTHSQIFFKISVLKNLARKNTCVGVRPTTLLKRDSNTCFSCEHCKIFKNTFFYRTPLVAASDVSMIFPYKYQRFSVFKGV